MALKPKGGIVRFLITGGTGFIGQYLIRSLSAPENSLSVLTRNKQSAIEKLPADVLIIDDLDALNASEHFDVIINLAGEPLVKGRWTAQRKNEFIDSRIRVTKSLLKFIERCERRPELLLSASAVGYYGAQGKSILTEDSEPALGFTHTLCSQWEKEAKLAALDNVRVCILRLGVVLHPSGGLLKQMLMPFKLGLGGKLGNGRQWLSWVHLEDVLSIMAYLIEHKALEGEFNVTAPQPVTNEEFSKLLAAALKKPTFLDVPALPLRLLFGEMADELLLVGQNVVPHRLLEAGYQFQFSELAAALDNVLTSA